MSEIGRRIARLEEALQVRAACEERGQGIIFYELGGDGAGQQIARAYTRDGSAVVERHEGEDLEAFHARVRAAVRPVGRVFLMLPEKERLA